MPTTNAAGGPRRSPVIREPAHAEQNRSPVPGFDLEGQPLPDAEVWNVFLGKDRRPLDTAAVRGAKTIDGWEAKALLKLATQNPKAFMQRLLADSANGTAVRYQFTKELDRLGVLKIDFEAKDGKVSTRARLEIYNRAADRHLKAYLAKDPRTKGTRSSLELKVSGALNRDGGLDGVELSLGAHDIPKLSAEKLAELDRLKKDLKDALEEPTKVARERGVKEVFRELMDRMEDFPLPFFLNLITDSKELQLTAKEKGEPMRARAEVGNGKYTLTVKNLLGRDADEPHIAARLEGTASKDDGTLSIKEARVYSERPISLEWNEDNTPAIYRHDPKTGKKTKIQDHVADIMMYLPMVLALSGGRL